MNAPYATAVVAEARAPCAYLSGRIVRVPAGEVRAFDGASTAIVRCVAGVVWVTQEANPMDVVLAAGQRFVAARHGKIVVQSLDGPACVAVG